MMFYKDISTILSNNLYFDYIYNNYISKPFLLKSYTIFIDIIDKGLLELFFIFNITNNIYNLFVNYKKFGTGNLFNYINMILFFILAIIVIFICIFFNCF